MSGAFSDAINSAAQQYGVPAALIKAVATQESSLGQSSQNVMQVSTLDDSVNPVDSINKGSQMLANLWNQTGGDIQKTLAAYNMGPGILSYINDHPEASISDSMQSFSDMQKERNGYNVYGDPQYIAHVTRYL